MADEEVMDCQVLASRTRFEPDWSQGSPRLAERSACALEQSPFGNGTQGGSISPDAGCPWQQSCLVHFHYRKWHGALRAGLYGEHGHGYVCAG